MTIFAALIILGSLFFATNAGTWLVKESELSHADGMIVLMGSNVDRALEASDLYNSKYTSEIILVKPEFRSNELLNEKGIVIPNPIKQFTSLLVDLGIPIEKVTILPGNASSTQVEIQILNEFLQTQAKYDTLLLVSSAEHTRRASMIINASRKNEIRNITFLYMPSKYTDFNCKKWWMDKDDIEIVIMEYLKIINFLLFDKHRL